MEWIEFSQLKSLGRVDCRSYLRTGGVSPPPFDSLNLATGVGDTDENVDANLKSVKEQMGCQSLIWMNQVHGAQVYAIEKPPPWPIDCDGLTTATPGLALMVKHADCQPAIFYDPLHHAVAAVHCGWRGSVQNIYARAIEVMEREYGSHPSDLIVCIGPSIGPCHAEFVNYRQELPEEFWSFQIEPNHFDFWAISRKQLEDAGVPSGQIEIAQRCTYSEPDHFFSYRRDKRTGRNATVVVLN